MDAWTIYLLAVAGFVLVAYFFEEKMDATWGHAAKQTGGAVLALAFLTLVSGAISTLYY